MYDRSKNYRPTPRKRTSATQRTSNSAESTRRPALNAPNKLLPIAAVLASLLLVGTFAFALTNGKGATGSSQAAGTAQATSSDAAAASGDAATSSDGVAKATEPYSISFVSTGDFIIWRNEAQYVDENGGASPVADVAEYLASADVAITNVESPLSDNDTEPVPDKDVYILGRPAAIDSIEACGIDMASMANNHIMDYGGPALKDTIDALDRIGVKHAGAGMTEEEAGKIAELEKDGVKIALLSWTDIVPDYFIAYGDEPGVVSARLNMDDACKRVREAKATHDIVLVSMHWGIEYEHYTDPGLQDDPAHKLVDAGADVILGNHPHVVQGIEFYKDSLIAYAHGNFVFYQLYDDCHESYLLGFDMTNEGIKNVVLTPLHLDDEWGIPHYATGEQAQATLERLQEISSDMNTQFEIRDDKAYVTPASGQTGNSQTAPAQSEADQATSDQADTSQGAPNQAEAGQPDSSQADTSQPTSDQTDA